MLAEPVEPPIQSVSVLLRRRGQPAGLRLPQPQLLADLYIRDPGGASGTPNYDNAPDGRPLVMVRPVVGMAAETDKLILVQNFFEELCERTGN